MKKLFILLVILYSFCAVAKQSFAAYSDNKGVQSPAKAVSIHDMLLNYVQAEEKSAKAPVKLGVQETVFLIAVDLFFSVLCLWLALLLYTGERFINFKMYFWFLFVINFSWFIFLLLFRLIWELLDYLVIKLQPDMYTAVEQNFTLVVLAAAVIVYIWLLARTYNLKLYGAVGVFFISHLIFFSALLLCFTFIPSQENRLLSLVKENIGIKPIVASYISDIRKITAHENVGTMLRFRAYHL